MVFDPLAALTRFQATAVSARAERADLTAIGVVLDGRTGSGYSEQAFRHFLALERTRAALSERPLMLLLVSLRRHPDLDTVFTRPVSLALFSALQETVREVDFIGWYREGRIAAAVLAQGVDAPAASASSLVAERVKQTLGSRLPDAVAGRLRVRVLQLGPNRNL
jgi:hypothetical protein